MPANVTTDQIWKVIEKEPFSVLGMVTANGESRTVGVVHITRDRRLYIGTGIDTWKARHIAANPNVSITVPIPKRVFFLPWFKIPAATVSFSGTAKVFLRGDVSPDMKAAVFRGLAEDPEADKNLCVIEVTPHGDFLTYGIGVPLQKMRYPDEARGRAATG